MKTNISTDSRVDAFARELAIALRRITRRQVENKPANLPAPKLKENQSKSKSK
jgi:hypothetical protein